LILVTAWQPDAWLTLTLGSAYFWATWLLWSGVAVDGLGARRPIGTEAS
jgi:hypothetical protein